MSRGFTLIEVVAALVIMAIGLFTVLESFVMGNKIVVLRKERTAVVHLLGRIMEEAKIKGFNADVDSAGDCVSFPECTDICAQLKGCTFAVTKQDYGAAGLHMKRIDVTVSWSSTLGETRDETITTVITDR